MKRLTSIVLAACCVAVCNLPVGASIGTPYGATTNGDANQFTVVSWNVDSGGADPHVVSVRISQMKDVALWGLCEVRDDRWAKLFEQAASGTEKGRFARILSTTGGIDRSCILYDRTRFECLGYFELNWSGEPWYRCDLGLRPGLVAHLRHRAAKRDFYFVVNRLYVPWSDKQAAMLSAWAGQQDAPVVAVGTYDFEYRPETQMVSAPIRRTYPLLTANGVFQWLVPDNPVRTVWRQDLDGIDDFVFLADSQHVLAGRSQVIVEQDDFPDTDLTPDHRPVLATFTVRPSGW